MLRVAGYVTVTLMTFDKQSNGRRIVVVTAAQVISGTGVLDVLNDARVAGNPTAPVEHAVAALAARPGGGRVATPTAHPVTAVLAARCRVTAAPAHAAVSQRRVRLAERRRVLVEDEISARGRPLRRVDRN